MLRIIAIFILIYLAFRVFTLYVLPWVIRWYLGRVKKKFYEQNPHLRQEEPQPRKGKSKVNITYSKTGRKSADLGNVGEYVDFEEVKDKNKSNSSDK